MTYKEAVGLLAPDRSTADLDRVLGFGSHPAATYDPRVVQPYFDTRPVFLDLLGELTADLKERVGRATRTEFERLIWAAHAVTVVRSYSEELVSLLRDDEPAALWAVERRAWNGAENDESRKRPSKTQLLTWGNRSAATPPSAGRSLSNVTDNLSPLYNHLNRQVLEFLQGLDSWEKIAEANRRAIERRLRATDTVLQATERYLDHYASLAADVPEFLAWTVLAEVDPSRSGPPLNLSRNEYFDPRLSGLVDHLSAKLDMLTELVEANAAALGDLPTTIAALAPRQDPEQSELLQQIGDCNKAHQRVLDKPLLTPRLDAALERLQFPANRDGYINPNFRLYETRRSDEGNQLAQELWWKSEHPLRSGLGAHLAAYFRGADSTRRPLLVLGDPGSGKSLLSKVLAARLPPDEFAVARVELRRVRSSQEVSEQVDLELQRQTGNRLSLSDLTDPAGRIVRVVIMDGLDELLQLSSQEGLGRYLDRLVEFQEIEASYDRPVIAIATARTIVMDRVFIPNQTTVVKLEGFTDTQIRAWIEVWNATNEQYFADRGLEPLSPATLRAHFELARQPLLLALLALYDAEDNALRNAGELSQAELYERLFRRYLEREIERESLPVRREQQEESIGQRFRELSTIAMGMLNRGRRFITRQELEQDYTTVTMSRHTSAGVKSVVAVDDAVGQFFFLYRAEAQHRGSTLSEGYEFIHATFGEFLGARMIAQQLAQAAKVLQDAPVWDRPDAERHARSLLIPYLARRPLVGEEEVLTFLGSVVGGLVDSRERSARSIAGLMPSVIRAGADDAIVSGGGDRHRFERLATLSINLVMAALYTADVALPLGSFCESDQDPLAEWRRLTVLWKAYLAIDDWDRILRSLALVDRRGQPSIRLGVVRDPSASDLEAELSPPTLAYDLSRTIMEARLVGDGELAAAGIAWHQIRRELRNVVPNDPFEDDDDLPVHSGPDSNWRLAAAAIRAGTVATRGVAIETTLDALSGNPVMWPSVLEIVEGGVGTWSDAFLKAIADVVVNLPRLVCTTASLLRLVRETDRRGHAVEARRLLQRVPDAFGEELSPADRASVVVLSRRHQLRGLIGRCLTGSHFTAEVMERLGVEDVLWLMVNSGLPDDVLLAVRRDMLAGHRFSRMIQAAEALSSLVSSEPRPDA